MTVTYVTRMRSVDDEVLAAHTQLWLTEAYRPLSSEVPKTASNDYLIGGKAQRQTFTLLMSFNNNLILLDAKKFV